jgi:hypothetical protein
MPEPFWNRFFDSPEILGIMLPIVAVIAAAIVIIIKLLIRHRERMTMIERGMHPDYPVEDAQDNTQPPLKP